MSATNSKKKAYSFVSQDEKDFQPSESVALKKELGLIDGVGIIIGVIVGSGIFVSPKGVLIHAGSVGLSLIVWFLCGFLSMCGAACYAELGTSIPKSGGEFAYLSATFGPLLAFLYLWVALLIIMPTGNAIIALTFAEYILQPLYTDCQAPDLAVKLLAVAVILFLTFVNCYSVKWATRIQDSFAFAKIMALIVIISAGVYNLCFGTTENLSKPFEESSWHFSDISLAFYSGMFSFSGWNSLNFVTEELKHPSRDLPRAIYISLPLVSVIYLLTNVAYFSVLTKGEILASSAVAGAFGDKILGVMAWLMPLCVALSTFGGLNGGIFSSARLFFVGAREGHLPNIVSMINMKFLTPSPSLIFLAVITILYLWVGGIYVLINFTSFIEALFLTLTTASLLYNRIKAPKLKRPIKVNLFFPIAFLFIGTLLVVLPFFKNFHETGIALAITFSGIPVYFIFVYWKNKPSWMISSSDFVTKIIQKLLLCIVEDENESNQEAVCQVKFSKLDDDTNNVEKIE